MSEIEIREFKNGAFQVWRGEKVLRPDDHVWLNSYHKHHDFMFFKKKKEALKQLKETLEKETCVKIHKISIESSERIDKMT